MFSNFNKTFDFFLVENERRTEAENNQYSYLSPLCALSRVSPTEDRFSHSVWGTSRQILISITLIIDLHLVNIKQRFSHGKLIFLLPT